MSARRYLGGLLSNKAAKRAGNRNRKREKRKRGSDASSNTSSDADRGEFGLVPSRDGNRIQVTGEREPEKLLASGLHQIKSYLSMRGGAGGDGSNDELATVVVHYLDSVFHGAHPQSSTSLRNSRELRTIAECIDALLAGYLPHLGDLLIQRLKAVQTAVVEGNWNLAQHLELIPTSGSNVVSPAELRAAPSFVCKTVARVAEGSARTPHWCTTRV